MSSQINVDKIQNTAGTGDIFTLPTADGTEGAVLLTDGSGALSFGSPLAGGASVSEPGKISGLEFNISSGDTDHDIEIEVGYCMDSTNTVVMALTSSITKRVDAAWAVGSGFGGLDGTETTPGTPDADTLYAIWLIKRSDTGLVDVCFSESMSAPTCAGSPIPAAYDYYRFIGYVWIDSSNNIKPFLMRGNVVWFTKASESIVVNSAKSNFDNYGDSGNPIDLSSFIPTGHYTHVYFGTQSTSANISGAFSYDGTYTFTSVYCNISNTGDSDVSPWDTNGYNTGCFIPLTSDQVWFRMASSVSGNILILIHAVRLKNR